MVSFKWSTWVEVQLMNIWIHRVSCKRKFNKRMKMTDHMRTHTGERFVACSNCGSTFNSYVKFYDHYRRQAITSKLTSLWVFDLQLIFDCIQQIITRVTNVSNHSTPRSCSTITCTGILIVTNARCVIWHAPHRLHWPSTSVTATWKKDHTNASIANTEQSQNMIWINMSRACITSIRRHISARNSNVILPV